MISPQYLTEIEERVAKATEGPWEEQWRQIPGFDGYEVSDFGSVRSYYRKGNWVNKRAPYPRVLSLASKKGYLTVSLPVMGVYATRTVHRLVMLAFEGPCPEGYEVAHLNGDGFDNRRSNLAYVTHVENESHKAAHKTAPIGERNGASILQGWQVAEIKYLAEKSVPQGKIAALFGIGHKLVSQILSGDTWRHQDARTDIPALVSEVKALREALSGVDYVSLLITSATRHSLSFATPSAPHQPPYQEGNKYVIRE